MKKLMLVAAMLIGTPVLACPEFPRHPNMHKAAADLCAAQKAMHEAIEANKKELGGHAVAAEKAMHEAMEEIEQAAKYANEHKAK